MGLEDHNSFACALDTLMIQAEAAKKATDNPCDTGPTPQDVSSVRCNVYGYCGDFSGDTCTDVLARRSDGLLFMYKGDCAGGWGSGGIQIGSGWNQFTAIARPGDFSGDGCTDVLTRRSDGLLFMYQGNCAGGWGSGGIQIGSDWNQFTAVLGPGDFNGDGCADVIARRSDGLLFMYKGNCGQGGVWWKDNGVATQIGSGWNGYDWLVGPGDFDGDGCVDVMARSPVSNGRLFLYRGNCAAGWSGDGQQIGSGWNQFTWIF
jgi:hypothetical protein